MERKASLLDRAQRNYQEKQTQIQIDIEKAKQNIDKLSEVESRLMLEMSSTQQMKNDVINSLKNLKISPVESDKILA